MATVKVLSIASAVVGLLLLGSIIGYSGEDLIPEVPKPDAGMCGVTKEAYTDVPGSGAFIDIDVEITWSDNSVWIGIIDVQTYESLQKLGGNSEGEIVSCDSGISFVAGGPSASDSKFQWQPDGEAFHIMIGSLEDASDDEEEEEDEDPWPFSDDNKANSFVSEFDVTVNYDASGGWVTIIILFGIEIGLVYLIRNQ